MAVIFIRLPSSIASGFGGLFIFFAFRRNGYFKIESRPDARLTLPKAKLKLSLGWFVPRVTCGTAVDPRSARRRKINHASSIIFLFRKRFRKRDVSQCWSNVSSLWIISWINSNRNDGRRSKSEIARSVQSTIDCTRLKSVNEKRSKV